MNNFHRIWFQNFRQFSNLFSQIWVKKRQTPLFSGICREIRTKIHQKFAEKNAKNFDEKNEKSEIEWLIPPWSFSTFFFLSVARWARKSCRLIPDMIQTDKIRYATTRSESEWMQAGAKIGSPRYAVQKVKRKHRTATSYASWANRHIVDWQNLRY